MKILDRYVLFAFLRNYLVSCAVLVGLYVMMDAFFNFDEFADGAAADMGGWELAGAIGTYYLAQALFVYGQLAGVIPVVAAAFTLMAMSRFNELTALLAAGVPLLRVAAPAVVASVTLNMVLQPLNQEFVVPRLASWLTLDRDEAASGSLASFPVRSMPDGRGGMFDSGRFTPAAPEAIGGDGATADLVTIIERPAEDGGDVSKTTARRAVYDGTRQLWRLTEGLRVRGLAPADLGASVAPPRGEPVAVWDGGISPAEIRLFRAADLSVGAGGSYFDLLSTSQLNDLLSRPDRPASPDLLRAKHTRIASYVMNLVLMLLAVPAVLTRQPGQLRRAAGRTLAWVGAAMATVFFCQMLARDPPFADPALAARWPAVMSWLPVFVFGPASVWMLDRLET